MVLKGNGKHFQAGADLKWINGVRPKSAEENEAVSRATFEAVQRLNTLPIPTVALVQGGCFGGGTGVISACDVVVAADNALFSITEVRWGLTAAIIIPQLCDAIGVRQVRRYALTGERFGAEEARRIGLVHEVVPLAELEAAGGESRGAIARQRPRGAWRKQRRWRWKARSAEWAWMTRPMRGWCGCIRTRRQTERGVGGLASFAEKRGGEVGSRTGLAGSDKHRVARCARKRHARSGPNCSRFAVPAPERVQKYSSAARLATDRLPSKALAQRLNHNCLKLPLRLRPKQWCDMRRTSWRRFCIAGSMSCSVAGVASGCRFLPVDLARIQLAVAGSAAIWFGRVSSETAGAVRASVSSSTYCGNGAPLGSEKAAGFLPRPDPEPSTWR